MKKIIYSVAVIAAMMASTSSYAQLVDEKDVTITMDLQPILQLNMSTADQVEFVFDDIQDYIGGLTKYAATTLKVSSSVSWDLYAVGNSSQAQAATGNFWDQQVVYGPGTNTNAIDNIPLSALEIHQEPANQGIGTGGDYSAAFPLVGTPSATNVIYDNTAAGTDDTPDADERYIAGAFGTAAGQFIAGGSYLTSTFGSSNYYYTIDYRIVPGLPAIFPNADSDINVAGFDDLVTIGAAGNYAQPGVYTMFVQYILLEDQ